MVAYDEGSMLRLRIRRLSPWGDVGGAIIDAVLCVRLCHIDCSIDRKYLPERTEPKCALRKFTSPRPRSDYCAFD